MKVVPPCTLEAVWIKSLVFGTAYKEHVFYGLLVFPVWTGDNGMHTYTLLSTVLEIVTVYT